jgi:hypothetical protein
MDKRTAILPIAIDLAVINNALCGHYPLRVPSKDLYWDVRRFVLITVTELP